MTIATVVIPCLNAATTLRPVLEALNGQEIRHQLEVVVVDNGSADDTVRIASSLADRVLVESRPGSYAARNRGLSECDTEFIFSVDSDCRPRSSSWAERHLAALQAAPPDVLATAAPLLPEPSVDWWSQRADVTPQPGVDADGTVIYPVGGNRCSRTDLLRTLGGFPAFGADDAALGRRALRAGLRFIWVPDATAYHRNPSGLRGYHRQMRKAAQYATELDGPVPPRSVHGWAMRRITRATLGVGKRVLRGQLREGLAFAVKVDAQIRGAMDIWAEPRSGSSK
jgi:glycosyltransferase involved in cell wall biosynthesis